MGINNQKKIAFTLLQNVKKCERYTGFSVMVVWMGVAPSLRCRKNLKNLHAKSQLFSFYSVHTDGRTGGETDMAISTRLMILIINIYTL